jgi:putative ABC transport system permease protein
LVLSGIKLWGSALDMPISISEYRCHGLSVAQRRKEIAIRIALGASKVQVLGLVLREGTALVSVGTVLGFLGAVALAKIVSSLANMFVDAFRVGTNDPLAQLDPLKALREK